MFAGRYMRLFQPPLRNFLNKVTAIEGTHRQPGVTAAYGESRPASYHRPSSRLRSTMSPLVTLILKYLEAADISRVDDGLNRAHVPTWNSD
jgi:hypothetical protein